MSFKNNLNLEVGAILNTQNVEKTLKDLDAKLVMTIHDEVMLECPALYADEVSEILDQIDELTAHQVPEPVVAPEPIEIKIPDPIVIEEPTEEELPEAEAAEEKAKLAEQKAEAKANWEEAKMSPSQRQAKMQEERDAQIAAANERKAAADARTQAAKNK